MLKELPNQKTIPKSTKTLSVSVNKIINSDLNRKQEKQKKTRNVFLHDISPKEESTSEVFIKKHLFREKNSKILLKEKNFGCI